MFIEELHLQDLLVYIFISGILLRNLLIREDTWTLSD